MVTKVQKGNQFQDWIQVWLEERGWCVHNQKSVAKQVRTNRGMIWVSKRNDIFGCIDLVAVNGDECLFIQATMDQGKGRKLNDLLPIAWPRKCSVQVWIDRGKRRVTVFELSGEELINIGEINKRQFTGKFKYGGKR